MNGGPSCHEAARRLQGSSALMIARLIPGKNRQLGIPPNTPAQMEPDEPRLQSPQTR